MNHLLSFFFAMIFSVGHEPVAHKNNLFVPPAEFALDEMPVPNHALTARRIAMNSYSEVACLSCRTTNAISQPHWVLRAQR